MSDDHAESPRGIIGLLADEKEGNLQKNCVNIQTPKNKVKEYENELNNIREKNTKIIESNNNMAEKIKVFEKKLETVNKQNNDVKNANQKIAKKMNECETKLNDKNMLIKELEQKLKIDVVIESKE